VCLPLTLVNKGGTDKAMISKIYTAPSTDKVFLGKTLPLLLDEACENYLNSHAFNQHTEKGWTPLSNQDFRTTSEYFALGLLEIGLEKGDRVCLFMHSDLNFAIADMGCLIAQLVDVPLYLTQTMATTVFIIQHTEAKALVISNRELLQQIAPSLSEVPNIKTVIVAETSYDFHQTLPSLPDGIQVFSMDDVRARGKKHFSVERRQQLRAEIAPNDLATIVYTSGTTGEPKGVMLTHENISAQPLAAFGCAPEIEYGSQEVALLFLPMAHIAGRTMLYAHLGMGHSIYFTTPERVGEHLREVQPTILLLVPRLLEKIYEKILEKGNQLTGLTKIIFGWTLNLAKRYEMGKKPTGFYATQLKIADKLVFTKWRSALGGRFKCVMSGGAALRTDLAHIFSAARINIMPAYGLTESSAGICGNRGQFNRVGTVGIPIPGVEMAIADDGEILARSPYIMKGYYKAPEATREAIDEEGWLHTGDIGEFSDDGFLTITDRKKNLFKLSTGEYVTPQPLESQLQQSPLIEHAIAVGTDRKFCAMLIFPNLENLRHQAKEMGLDMPIEALLTHPKIRALYQALVEEANTNLPPWSTIKHFKLINSILTVENEMLTSILKVRRLIVNEFFAADIDSMYTEAKSH